MNVLSVTVVLQDNIMDQLIVHTDLPSTAPYVTNQSASFVTWCQIDTALVYAMSHFPNVPVEVINNRS